MQNERECVCECGKWKSKRKSKRPVRPERKKQAKESEWVGVG